MNDVRRRTVWRPAVACVGALGLLALGAAPAEAALPGDSIQAASAQACVDAANRSRSPDGGACVYFQPYDELLYVCDTETDGHHPEGDYAAEAGDYKRGAAYYGGAGGCLIIDLALPEGSWIEYRARNVEGSTTLSTGPTIKDYA